MLMSFSVANFRSIGNEQKLSFVSDNAKEHIDNTYPVTDNSKIRLLRSCAIYGANGSGKSNLLKALNTMRIIVTSSSNGDELPVIPFVLDRAKCLEPSLFEINICISGDRYQYGFSCTKEKIINEWLYVYPHVTGKRRTWYERLYNDETKKYCWNLTNNLKGQKTVWRDLTRDDAIYLKTAALFNCQSLKPLYDFFNKDLCIILNVNSMSIQLADDHNLKYEKEVIRLLKATDFNISALKVEKVELDYLTKKLIHAYGISSLKGENSQVYEPVLVKTVHTGTDGELIEFDLNKDEANGTVRLIKLAQFLIDALKKGKVLVVDDLNISFHPFLTKFLIDYFHRLSTNPNNAQLLFTTHESTIMSQDLFRRDEIWFTKLNSNQMTEVYPLTDFKPLKGSSNERLDVKYLNGKYGALPYVDLSLIENVLNDMLDDN